MYRFKCIVLILLLISLPLYCELIEVDIAGNYDYVSIQAAIEEAESGDEILVYPGVYFENVDFLGKQIELKSLFATTGERHYIAETVINGNETGSCVKVVNYEPEGTSITGFTLTGGSGTEFDDTERFYGGGIYSLYSSLSVFSCIIEENAPTISLGGGIAVGLECNMFLSDTIIRNNVVDTFGGGIFFINRENSVIFDQENRCSIYNNYSPRGADIYCWYEGGNTEVYLDTITVEDYEGYYVFQYLEAPPWFYMTGLNIYYENTWMEPIDADLYVSPEGDDENSGLCWDDPLKSITWANQKIAVNPESMHTIYLDEGVYSASTTGEKMPFQLKDNITLSGASPETTIIDAELSSPFMRLSYGHY